MKKTIQNIILMFFGFTLYANATGAEALIISSLISAGTALAAATNKPDIPKPPKQPDQIVGVQDQASSAKTLEEDPTQMQSARKVARQGAAAYRIPLQAKSTGINTGGGSGLNI